MDNLNNLSISISSKLKSLREMFPVKTVNKYKKDSMGVIIFVIDYLLENNKEFYFLKNKEIYLDLIFMDDKEIEKINSKYRGKKEATNVISLAYFTADDFKNDSCLFNCYLGEIYISFETLLSESEEQRVILEHHFFRLLIHGFLHLLGFDHEIEKDAILMYNTEEVILAKLQLSTNSLVANYWR